MNDARGVHGACRAPRIIHRRRVKRIASAEARQRTHLAQQGGDLHVDGGDGQGGGHGQAEQQRVRPQQLPQQRPVERVALVLGPRLSLGAERRPRDLRQRC